MTTFLQTVTLREQDGQVLATYGTRTAEGRSRAEALGKLFLAHGEEFGIKVTTELAPKQQTPAEKAGKEFMGVVCPVCSEPKQSGYWFCQKCWGEVTRSAKEIREKLWQRKFDAVSLTWYWKALYWLKQQKGATGG